MDGERKDAELVSPTPQRAYAFVSLLGDGELIVRPQSTPWAGVGQLVRPTSAPVSSSGPLDRTVCFAIERPASPFSRVTNPMVRDTRFLRGSTGLDKGLGAAPPPAAPAAGADVRDA